MAKPAARQPADGQPMALERPSLQLDQLWQQHGRASFSLAYRITGDHQLAEDAVHSAFAALLRHPDGAASTRATILASLLASTHRLAVQAIRRPQRRHLRASAEQLLAAIHIREQPPPGKVASRAAFRPSQLQALPPAEREVIVMAYFGGYTQAEIAKLTNRTLDTIRRHTLVGMRHLNDQQAHPPPTDHLPGHASDTTDYM